jgi:hypothetical protein
MVVSTESGFVASPSYIASTLNLEYIVAGLFILLMIFRLVMVREWNWGFIFLPIVALLFSRMWVVMDFPFIANFVTKQSIVTANYRVKSKERVKRCSLALQLTSDLESRLFDHFNFCGASRTDYETIKVGQILEMQGVGSKWGFYPRKYRVANK